MSKKIKLGKIREVFFGIESHDCLTLSIVLDYGGGRQSYGGYQMDRDNSEKGMKAIRKLLEVFEVENFKELEGKYVEAICSNNYNGVVKALKAPDVDGGKVFSFTDCDFGLWL